MLMISFLLENDESMFAKFKSYMMFEFDMTNIGKMRYFLGIKITQRSYGIFISQRKYALEALERFGMSKSNSVLNLIVSGCKLLRDEDGVKMDNTLYKQAVRSFMYLTTTRPYLIFMVSLISRYISSLTKLYIQAAKRVLRYLRGIINFRMFYKKRGN